MLSEKAWKVEPRTMPMAAMGKWMLIVRRATTPIDVTSAGAEKTCISCSGKSQNTMVPASMATP